MALEQFGSTNWVSAPCLLLFKCFLLFPCIFTVPRFHRQVSESDKDQQMPKVLSKYKTALLSQGLLDLKACVYSLCQYFQTVIIYPGFLVA